MAGKNMIPNHIFGELSARNHQISRDVFSVPVIQVSFFSRIR